MATTDYTSLDATILALIERRQPILFIYISADLRMQADALAKEDRYGMREGWRLIDRRLQVLRKAGSIKYQRKPEGWVLVVEGA